MGDFINPILRFFVVSIIAFNVIHAQLVGSDCSGKNYICVDPENYQVCSDLPDGRSETTDAIIYPCPPDSYCDDSGQVECDSTSSPEVDIGSVRVSLPDPPQTDDSESPSAIDSAAETDSSTIASSLFSCTEAGYFPDITSCHNYYHCVQLPLGLLQIHNNCLQGMAFDPITELCTSDTGSCETDKFCTERGTFPDPSDPSGYFRCTWNGSGYEKYHSKCGLGQRFNEKMGRCTFFGLRVGGPEPDESPMKRMPGRGGYN